jgi:protein-L-isoaspartate(D-aspartate) O-methyltransferase
MEDNYRHQGLRKQLVDTLRSKGITNERVLDAIARIPRHQFIDDTAFLQMAYADIAFPIGCGQTISQPYTVAFQTSLLELSSGMKVLEIGTGSGYQTAVLSTLGVKIFSIERQKPLYLRTKERLQRMGYKAALFHGDGYLGLPRETPFDRILVTCGAPQVPQVLLQQLKIGGRAVIPVGEGGMQIMLEIVRKGSDAFEHREHGDFRFVPMLEQKTG